MDNSINLKVIHNAKFKSANIGCFFRLPFNQKNLALANVASSMQSLASQDFPSVGIQAKALESLYNMNLEIYSEVFGNQIVIFYVANFVEPRMILDPNYNFQKIIDTFFRIVTKPLVNQQILGIAKQQVENEFKQFYDVPANFALKEFLGIWYRKNPEFADNVFGDFNTIQNCTIELLANFFESLKQCPAIFLASVENENFIKKLVKPNLNFPGFRFDFKVDNLVVPCDFDFYQKDLNVEVEQAQLLLGFGYDNNLSSNLRQFGGLILSQYLSGDESSKLFSIIREDLGAAYAIDANNFLNNSLFLINAGLQHEKVDQVRDVILHEINKIASGNIDLDLLKKSKLALKRTFLSGEDNQDVIIIQMLANALRKEQLTNLDRISLIEHFSDKQLIKFCKSLIFNESFCLK